MATKKPVAKPVTKSKTTPGITATEHLAKQAKAVKQAASKPVPKKATPKAAPVKSVIKTESKVKSAVAVVKETVKKAVAKAAAPVVAVKVPAPTSKRQPAKTKAPVKAPQPKIAPEVKPAETKAKLPWESAEGDKLEAALPPPVRVFPLIPVHRPGVGAEVFSNLFDHDMEIDGEKITVHTGYLSVNRSLDLLGLSSHDGFMQKGLINNTDEIVGDIRLASLHISINGKDKFVNCESIPHKAVADTDFRTLKLELTVIVRDNGRTYAISALGNVNIQMGTCYLSATSNPDVEVKGYFLDANRGNQNRM